MGGETSCSDERELAPAVKLTARCVKCMAVVEVEIPAFKDRLDYAMGVATMMRRPGVVILCDDCTPKEATTK